ncbi:MAG: ElyC/SanA/YdcF family protein [Bacteroidales bacterium]
MNKKTQIILNLVFIGSLISCIAIFVADMSVKKIANERVIDKTDILSDTFAAESQIILLLGTAKYLKSGAVNPYYQYRIDATIELFNTNKIKHIVISGDNSRKDYNEPQDMMDDLMKRGIPSNNISLDYAGFDTYDSILRMKHIFNQDRFIVVSQKFHCDRAVYIAHWNGLNVWGYHARDLNKYLGIKVRFREKLARVKMFLDLWSGRDPYFLGEQIEINAYE